MPPNLATIIYLVAAVLFMLSLGGLSRQETAKRGTICGIVGMLLALATSILSDEVGLYGIVALSMVPAALIGGFLAMRVQMTGMPQLVALLHSFVGAAAVLVGFASYLDSGQLEGAALLVHHIEVYLGVGIGATIRGGCLIPGRRFGRNRNGT